MSTELLYKSNPRVKKAQAKVEALEHIKQIIVPNNFAPRWYQLDALQAFDSGKRRLFLRWHRRSGKDKFCIALMAREMMKRVGSYYYIFPSYAQGRKILWEGIDKTGFKFLNHIPSELIVNTNKTEMTITLANGSILRVIGADAEKIDDIVGTNPVGIVLSEFGVEPTYGQVLDFFRPILRENGGWIVINGTPRGANHMFKLEEKIKHNDTWYVDVLQTIGPDYPVGRYSGVVSPEGIENERLEGMDEEMIEQEYGVSYTATSRGRIYEAQLKKARDDGRIGAFPVDDHKWVDTFWDIGKSDATAVWFRQIDGAKKIWIDYYEDEGKDMSHYIEMLVRKGYKFRTHYLPHDGRNSVWQTPFTNREMFEKLCESAGISSEVVACDRFQSKMDAIYSVRKNFSKYYFNEGLCSEGLEKLSLYHFRYDKKNQDLNKEPVHDFTSHAADALSVEVAAEDYEGARDDPGAYLQIKTDYDIMD